MTIDARVDAAVDETQPRVRVIDRTGGSAVVAARAIDAGDVIYLIDGPVVGTPSRFSVQIGAREHVDVCRQNGDERPERRHVWCYLNHCCSPNAMLRGRTLLALRPIGSGEEVTFDYDTTEWDMACPFPCACGSAQCRGLIRGFRHLNAAQRAAIRPLLAPHLIDGSCSDAVR